MGSPTRRTSSLSPLKFLRRHHFLFRTINIYKITGSAAESTKTHSRRRRRPGCHKITNITVLCTLSLWLAYLLRPSYIPIINQHTQPAPATLGNLKSGRIMTDSKISPFSSPKLLLARLSRLTSTIPGLDASLMLAQYSSPLVIALLLRLAAFKARHPKVTLVSGAGKRTLTVNGGFGLAKIADGWGNAAGSIGDARVVMRAFGR